MRWSTKDFLSFTLLAVGVDGPPIPIDDLLLAFASKRITNQLDASDWAARKTRQAISALVEYQNERVNTGREPHIKTILHVHPVEVVGAAWLSPEDDWQHRSKKLAISRTTGLHSNIQKLSPNEFEKLCERILVLMGCDLTSATKASHDQGIDFYGRINLHAHVHKDDIFGYFARDLHTWIIGQAKHFDSCSLGTEDCRALVGSVALSRSKLYALDKDPYQDLDVSICHPVVMLMMTSGDISAAARKLCNKVGIVARDGEEMAQFIEERLGVNVNDLSHDESVFKEWVRTGATPQRAAKSSKTSGGTTERWRRDLSTARRLYRASMTQPSKRGQRGNGGKLGARGRKVGNL